MFAAVDMNLKSCTINITGQEGKEGEDRERGGERDRVNKGFRKDQLCP